MRFSDFFFGQIPRRQPGSLRTILHQLPDMTRQNTTFEDGDNINFGSQVGNWKFRYLYKAQFCPNFGHKFFLVPSVCIIIYLAKSHNFEDIWSFVGKVNSKIQKMIKRISLKLQEHFCSCCWVLNTEPWIKEPECYSTQPCRIFHDIFKSEK